MTSMPASRRARATTLAPRSCPSSPGLAITTRIRPCATATSAPFHRGSNARLCSAAWRLGQGLALEPPGPPIHRGLTLGSASRPAALARASLLSPRTPCSSWRRERARDPPLLGKILPVGGIAPAGAAPPGAGRSSTSTEEPQSRAPGPDPPARRLPAAEGGQSAQADPAQPARAAVDAGGDPVRAGDPGCGDAVPGQGRAPLRAGEVVVVDRRGTFRTFLAPTGSCPVVGTPTGFARPCVQQAWDQSGEPLGSHGLRTPPPRLRAVPATVAKGDLYVNPSAA